MVPSMMEELLFDDILYGQRAREEHRRFQQVLGYVADEVLDARRCSRRSCRCRSCATRSSRTWDAALAWGPDMDYRLADLAPEALASALIVGIEKPAQEIAQSTSELYWLPPIPNYFFQRDPLAVVGDRAIRGSMATPARAREPLLSGYIFEHHPRFAREGRFLLVQRVLRRLRPADLLRADAADARGRRHPGLARGSPRDRLLGADGEDDHRASGRSAQEPQVPRQADLRRRDPSRARPSCTWTRSSR